MLFLKALGSKNRREDNSRQNRNELVVCTGKSQANMFVTLIKSCPFGIEPSLITM